MESIYTHHEVDVMGLKSHFIRFGNSERKLVFLHGWGGDTNSFLELANQLDATYNNSAENFRGNLEIIVLDLPGFGKSNPPREEGWSTLKYAHWLNNILEQYILSDSSDKNLKLNHKGHKDHFILDAAKMKNVYLYGHSFGCRVMVRFLTQIQPKWAGKIILTGAAGIKFPRTFRQNIGFIAAKTLKPLKYLLPTKLHKKIIAKLFGAHDWQNVSNAMKNTLRKTLAEPDFRDDLKMITQESLLIWGKNDTYTPLKAAEIYQQNLPHAKLEILETGRHGIGRTHPQEISELLQKFIK